MIRIDFDETLRTGDVRVDDQHRHLIEMFNSLHQASCDGCGAEVVGPLLDELHTYTIEHFTAEQRLMASVRFPADEMLEHVEEHGKLTARVRDLIEEYRRGGMATILPLATLLQEWLADHIRQRDRRLVEHVRLAGAAD
jgi:hemerythrin